MNDIIARIRTRRDQKTSAEQTERRKSRSALRAEEAQFETSLSPLMRAVAEMLERNAGSTMLRALEMNPSLRVNPFDGFQFSDRLRDYRFEVADGTFTAVDLTIARKSSFNEPEPERLCGSPEDMAGKAEEVIRFSLAKMAFRGEVDREIVFSDDSPIGRKVASDLRGLVRDAEYRSQVETRIIGAFRSDNAPLIAAIRDLAEAFPREAAMPAEAGGKMVDVVARLDGADASEGVLVMRGTAVRTEIEVVSGRVLVTLASENLIRSPILSPRQDFGSSSDPDAVATAVEDALVEHLADLAVSGHYDPDTPHAPEPDAHGEAGRRGILTRIADRFPTALGMN